MPNQPLLYLGLLLIVASLALIYSKKEKAAILFLFFGALSIRLFMAHLDPFLADWDEKFHALVARNMMDHPFKPMLKTEILIPYDYRPWCCNHIWLHKQPLFMWQMALSMKIFGVSEFTMRYPSVLLGALTVVLVYRIAKLYTKDGLTAYGAALLMCCSNYQLELISGYIGMDHNDLAFGFYVLASIWAYAEYINKKSIKWVILIGVFAGCAVLNKWLTGILVFSGWGINILWNIRDKDTRKEILHLLLAAAVCVVVFLPWQLYIFHAFPTEAAFEFEYNTRHIFEAIEGHGGHNEVYFNLFNEYFGKSIWVLMLAGIVISWFNKQLLKKINVALCVCTALVYIFFSLIVQTKMASYYFVVVPIGYIYMAVAVSLLLKIRLAGKIIFMAAILTFAYVLLDIPKIELRHNSDNPYRYNKIYNTNIYKNLHKTLPKDIKVLMNLGPLGDVELMFYNPGINAFHYIYSQDEFEVLKKDNIRIGVFKSRPAFEVPDYIKNYPGTFIIDQKLEPTIEHYR